MPDAIIDAHHHIWRLSETPWLQGPPVPRIFGAYDAIRRDYAIADYLADAKPSGLFYCPDNTGIETDILDTAKHARGSAA